MDVLLYETKTDLATISNRYERKNPGTLLDQFPNRKRKQAAIRHSKRGSQKTWLHFTPKVHHKMPFDFVFHLIQD